MKKRLKTDFYLFKIAISMIFCDIHKKMINFQLNMIFKFLKSEIIEVLQFLVLYIY